jgi:LysR family glycine cleavage system transcriptional activator
MSGRTRKLPRLLGLQAFESTARTGSVSRAAAELSLTQSAVSRQIQALESRLGLQLFVRQKKRLHLSEAGAAYLQDVQSALHTLGDATASLMGASARSRVLRIATLPTFGAMWLVPRLPRFREACPGVSLDIITRLAPFDFSIEQLDGAIHFGGPEWPGATVQHLVREELVAVASVRVAAACARPEDVLQQALIQITTRAFAWHEWLVAAGLPDRQHAPSLQVETFAMGLEATRAGLGVAILPKLFVDADIADGRLVAIGPTVSSRSAYYFVHPHHKRDDPLLRKFAQWLAGESRTNDS